MLKKFDDKLVEWKEQIDSAIKYLNNNEYHELDKYIEDKKIISLGENSHFVGDYYSSKIDVIKHLHKYHGFNVVIFESGLLEANLLNELMEEEGVKEGIKNSLLGIYHNEEILPLFTDPELANIKITGMDVQPTFKTTSNKVVAWIKDIDNKVGSLIEDAEKIFFEINEFLMKEPLKVSKKTKIKMKEAINKYSPVIELLENIDETVLKKSVHNKLQILKRGMLNRQQWLQVNLKGRLSSSSLRDIYMFENIKWLLKFYQDQKVIIWSHNFHIRKKRSLLLRLLRIQTVGHLLSKHYSKDTYTIGYYAVSGKCLTPYRDEFEISMNKEYHLELILLEKNASPILLPLQTEKKEKKSHWSRQIWWLLETKFLGMAPNPMKPHKFYDALLFLSDVKPPTYFEKNEVIN